MDAVRILEDEIREIVRRQGIDPQREHARVLTLIQDAAADYESRAVSYTHLTLPTILLV